MASETEWCGMCWGHAQKYKSQHKCESEHVQIRITVCANTNQGLYKYESGFVQIRIKVCTNTNQGLYKSESRFVQIRIRVCTNTNQGLKKYESGCATNRSIVSRRCGWPLVIGEEIVRRHPPSLHTNYSWSTHLTGPITSFKERENKGTQMQTKTRIKCNRYNYYFKISTMLSKIAEVGIQVSGAKSRF